LKQFDFKEIAKMSELAKSSKNFPKRGWFQNVLFWPGPAVTVEAEQIPIPGDTVGVCALAKVTIKKNGKIVHTAEIPFGMPVGEATLLLQVYTLSQQPDYSDPQWQRIRECFCRMHSNFEPPSFMWWSDEPMDL
jgi:hypothetical protein